MEIQGQGHGQGQTWWSHLRPRVQSICLLFVLWLSSFLAEIQQIPYLTLESLGQGHGKNWPKSNQVIYRSGPSILPKRKESEKVFRSYRMSKSLWLAAYRLVQKHKVTSSIPVRGDLIMSLHNESPGTNELTYCDQMMPYGDTDLSQHWLK